MSLQSVETPRFWIVAGPNGSGKSTLYGAADIEGFGRSVWIINPDLLAARLRDQEHIQADTANAVALDRIHAWLAASIDAHQTVGVETVLSTSKYRPLVLHAKKRGFEICLLYVTLKNGDLNVERVRARVAQGGHDVPEDRIRARRIRSLKQLPWFMAQSDLALIYDNSGRIPFLVARKRGATIEVIPDAPEHIVTALNS